MKGLKMEDGMNVYKCVCGDNEEFIAASSMDEAIEKYKSLQDVEGDTVAVEPDGIALIAVNVRC